MLITVFTPTYNRAFIIHNLYESLCRQTCQDFEWLIIDDGSEDNTESKLLSFILEDKIKIRYYNQTNGGKHRAINRGVKEAKGELFFIVDSDDYLANNAVEKITFHYENIKKDNKFAGVCGCKAYFSGAKVGGEGKYSILDCNSFDFRYKYKVKGDMAEVFKTDILKQYPFPEFYGENFISESIVWNKIACNYKLRYFNENIYFCEYLQDGLSAKIIKLRKKNPEGAMLLYSEMLRYNIPYIQKIKASVNFWRFAPYAKKQRFCAKFKKTGAVMTVITLPVGWLMYLNDKRSNS